MTESSRRLTQLAFATAPIPLVACLVSAQTGQLTGPGEPALDALFRKAEVTIAITDSGLGGLSVAAEAARGLKEAGAFRGVKLIFWNALFNEGGYNSLQTREEKVRIFSSALESLERNCRPDLVLIACNTLSVLYQDTQYARNTPLPVVGIVEAGADLIAEQLIGNPGSVVIIFATQTTVDEGTHLRKLVERGVTHDRIIQQSCSELVGFIEVGYRSDQTEMLISAYVEEAVQKLPTPRPSFFASLNCTHFGYSSELWSKAFEAAGVPPRAILNPNSRMLDFLFDRRFRHRYPKPAVSVTAVSMVEIQQDRISSIGEPLQQISPETARALREYAYRPNLFEWRAFIKRPGG